MNTVDIARAAGLVILLDGRIGRETYQSVTGTLTALERFAALWSEKHERAAEDAGAAAAPILPVQALPQEVK